ncbi:unnamed protein product, partial [Ixodes pacificus]
LAASFGPALEQSGTLSQVVPPPPLPSTFSAPTAYPHLHHQYAQYNKRKYETPPPPLPVPPDTSVPPPIAAATPAPLSTDTSVPPPVAAAAAAPPDTSVPPPIAAATSAATPDTSVPPPRVTPDTSVPPPPRYGTNDDWRFRVPPPPVSTTVPPPPLTKVPSTPPPSATAPSASSPPGQSTAALGAAQGSAGTAPLYYRSLRPLAKSSYLSSYQTSSLAPPEMDYGSRREAGTSGATTAAAPASGTKKADWDLMPPPLARRSSSAGGTSAGRTLLFSYPALKRPLESSSTSSTSVDWKRPRGAL